MQFERYVAGTDHEGMRADAFLASVSRHTRSHIAMLMKNEHVRCADVPVKPRDRVKVGQAFEVFEPEAQALPLKPQDMELDIIYQDDMLAVVNKPRGMVVHPGAGVWQGTLVNALLYHLDQLSGINGLIRPGIVHRLDKDTTGLMLVAKNDQAHQKLSKAIESRDAKREYIALVHGNIIEDEGTVDAPIARHFRERKRMAVVLTGRPARTHYRVLHRYGEMALLLLTLDTGRTHQIRVHMAHIHHPVVFDQTYGVKRDNGKGPGQLLHAYRISFTHPKTGERMTFCAPLPLDFERVLCKLGPVPKLF